MTSCSFLYKYTCFLYSAGPDLSLRRIMQFIHFNRDGVQDERFRDVAPGREIGRIVQYLKKYQWQWNSNNSFLIFEVVPVFIPQCVHQQ